MSAVPIACVWFGAILGLAWDFPAAGFDDDPKSQIGLLKRQLEDTRSSLVARERVVLELATALDKAALTAKNFDQARARWTEAASVLDEFRAANPSSSRARTFEVQAAVYLWARARSWIETSRINPSERESRIHAYDDLTDCVNRLKPIVARLGSMQDVFAQNVRFRSAQAQADMAEVGPDDVNARHARNAEALDTLGTGITEPSLAGYAQLLRGTLLTRLRRYDEARAAIDAAARANPAPSETDLVEARVALALAREEYTAAFELVNVSKVDAIAKAAQRIRIRLEQRTARLRGSDRDAADAILFKDALILRGSARPDAKIALIGVAQAIREPGPSQDPDAWDALAEGAVALGDLARAGSLEQRGADRALALGQKERAVELLLRGGAYLYQGEKFAEADPLLTRVVEDADAGPSRAKASLLRALARGRALALNRPGSSEAAYADALSYHVKTFSDDASTGEARWLLGKLRQAQGRLTEAVELWTAIPHGSPRWLASRVEIAAVQRHDLAIQRLNLDREAIQRKVTAARDFLDKAIAQSDEMTETNELLLAQFRLDLMPGVGRPEEAHRLGERLQRSVARPEQRELARRLDLVALAQMSRWVEAEKALLGLGPLPDPAAWLEIARYLDHSAADAESEVRVRRGGLLLRALTARILERAEGLSGEQRDEAQLRHVRALIFSGDDTGARHAVHPWRFTPGKADDDLMRDLADTYIRLEAYKLAVDVERLRGKQLATGSLSWFDARYGLALAYYRSGKGEDAYQLIDATAILHPELGGGELREKFLKLRQRVEPRR